MKETTKGKGIQLARKTEIVRDRDLVEWTETGKTVEEPGELYVVYVVTQLQTLPSCLVSEAEPG